MSDIDEIQTLAALSVLSHVAYTAAEYDTPVIAACRRSVVLTISEEVIKEACLAAGRPRRSARQTCVSCPRPVRLHRRRQRHHAARAPRVVHLMGCYYSESLILAETG